MITLPTAHRVLRAATASAVRHQRPAAAPLPVAPVRTALPGGPSAVQLASSALGLLAVLLLSVPLHLAATGTVFHARQQQLAYAELRADLAAGVAPVGPLRDGELLPVGTPVALLEAPAIDLHEVVREGTGGQVLAGGPGHRRDSVLPGQAGTAVVFGRRAGFGGPFSGLSALQVGDELQVTTGVGRSTYRVRSLRQAGDRLPPPLSAGQGRLVLVTAAGRPFLPTGVLRVDADLVGTASPSPAPLGSAPPAAERALAGDRGALLPLLLLSQALLLAGCAAAWARTRWGVRQAWIVGVPVLGGLVLAVAHQLSTLLPNLL